MPDNWGLKHIKSAKVKPDTKSRKQSNVVRYVTRQDPAKKATLNTGKPC